MEHRLEYRAIPLPTRKVRTMILPTRHQAAIAAALSVPVFLILIDAAFGQRVVPRPAPLPPRPAPGPVRNPAPNPGIPPGPPRAPAPIGPPPPRVTPSPRPVWITVTVWSCSRCGRELGQGARPHLTDCPGCGAHLTAIATPRQVLASESSVGSTAFTIALVLCTGACIIGLLLICGVLLVYLLRKRDGAAEEIVSSATAVGL